MKLLNIAPNAFWGLAILSATTAFSVTTPSATAITISGSSVQDISAADIGESFTVLFGGKIDGKETDGLLSKALFKVAGFETVTRMLNNITQQVTEIKFDVQLSNTSDPSILQSRTSGFGFDVSETLIGASVQAINEASNLLFQQANLDQKLLDGRDGSVDVCYSDQKNNCRGGKSGGVTTGNVGSFSTTLTLSSATKTIDLNNFGVRYQSIDLAGTKRIEDLSGTGYAVTVAPGGSKDWAEENCQDCHMR
ncbi:MAG: cistern family PEP-CTERM protein [Coleofasciculus sp. G3-WIS-01]|uniref:cistern family PEP-CTERM protein n=1 Tax=Coleofasciculus sp. G3-WIS-01 TaxID=3069528 RepID=UPI0032F81FED